MNPTKTFESTHHRGASPAPHRLARRGAVALAVVVAAALAGGCASTPPGAAASAAADAAPQAPAYGAAPTAVLWVGNSFFYYNNSLHGHFNQFVASAGDRVRGTSVTISGSGLDWHDLGSLLRPGGLGRYSFVGDNEIRFNPPDRAFDTVVMMDCSQCPVHPQLKQAFHDSVRRNAEIARSRGARPVLFMSWAYKDKPEMTSQLAAEYGAAGRANDAQVIPVGLAFARAIALDPTVELYVADKRHPSLAGTYLAAATAYAALFGKSPLGATYTAGLPAEQARLLRTAAWDAAQAWRAQSGR